MSGRVAGKHGSHAGRVGKVHAGNVIGSHRAVGSIMGSQTGGVKSQTGGDQVNGSQNVVGRVKGSQTGGGNARGSQTGGGKQVTGAHAGRVISHAGRAEEKQNKKTHMHTRK